MGLFGFLGRAIKGGLSLATHGASDQVLRAAGSVLGGKPKAAFEPAKIDLPPTLKEQALANALKPPTRTISRTESRSEGWGFVRGPQAAAKPKAKHSGPATNGTRPPRTPPSGAPDFAALSKSWRAAGKPVSWRDWIIQNSRR